MDVEKTMEFILEHLAQASVRLDQITARLDQVTANVNKLAEVQVLRAQVLDQHEDRLNRITEILRELAESQQRTEKELRESIQAREEAGRHTDARLNALIKVVDDMIRRDGRRRPKKKR